MRKTFIIVLIILSLLFVLTGCKSKEVKDDTTDMYNIYYYNDNSNSLSFEECYIQEDTQENIALEIYKSMANPEKKSDQSVIVNTLEIKDIVINEKIMYLYFPESYSDMDNIQEIKFRSAVVKSMIQIEGIDYVSFYVNNEPLIDDKGASTGLMEDNSFISNVNDALEETGNQMATIYFGDTTGKKLVGQTMSISDKNSLPIEQVVINMLIEGPKIKECTATIPKNVKVLSISTKEGICYINFDSSFLTSIADVSAEVALYSIVNTLCEIPEINQVQILVNGKTDSYFRENYKLSALYERNLDIIDSTYVVPSE